MITKSATPDDPEGLDRATLSRMLSLGGSALVAQLIADFSRLAEALGGSEVDALERAAHELKGLAATIGAKAIVVQDPAAHGARFDELAASLPPVVRAAMALGLCRQIDAVCALLRTQAPSAA